MIGSVAANSKPRLTRIYQAHSESFWPALTDCEAAGWNLKSVLMEQPDILQLRVQETVQTILEVEMPFGKLAVSPLCLCGSSACSPRCSEDHFAAPAADNCRLMIENPSFNALGFVFNSSTIIDGTVSLN